MGSMTRKIRRNMAKADAAERWEPLKKVWPEYIKGPSYDPTPRPRRSWSWIGKAIDGRRSIPGFWVRLFMKPVKKVVNKFNAKKEISK